jgi:hypothetical protein
MGTRVDESLAIKDIQKKARLLAKKNEVIVVFRSIGRISPKYPQRGKFFNLAAPSVRQRNHLASCCIV